MMVKGSFPFTVERSRWNPSSWPLGRLQWKVVFSQLLLLGTWNSTRQSLFFLSMSNTSVFDPACNPGDGWNHGRWSSKSAPHGRRSISDRFPFHKPYREASCEKQPRFSHRHSCETGQDSRQV